jgi:hypothetical protein
VPLIVCPACGRRRTLPKRPKGLLVCSVCGARGARVRYPRQIRWWEPAGEYEGLGREAGRHAAFAGFKWWAEHRGFKPGYPSQKFRAMFGCWPNGEQTEEGRAPGPDLLRWIRMQANAWKKQKRKEEGALAAKLVPKPEQTSALMTPDDMETSWR